MADNIDEEPLDSLTNTQPKNPSDEVIPTTGTAFITQNQETENMEVHHHAHHDGKKNWKSYFWEFLMLFLAVFCGFLAEYQLEHVIEHNREKQFMQLMVKDLMADTAILNEGFPRKDGRIKAIDSLFDYFSTHTEQNKIPSYVFNLMKRVTWDRAYDRNNVTISQLKNSGGMRLIQKGHVADSISFYDLEWEKAELWKQSYRELQGIIHSYNNQIVSDPALLSYYKNNLTSTVQLDLPADMFIAIDGTHLMEYMNQLSRQKAHTRQDKAFYQSLEVRAERLLRLIKKEYHME